MADTKSDIKKTNVTKAAAAGAAVWAASAANLAFGKYSDKIKIGLIGCGGRGSGAIGDSMKADPAVTLIALADLFEGRVRGCLRGAKNRFKNRVQVSDDHLFWGFDAYKKLCKTDVDIVLMATPPGFRPMTLRAAIENGKNVFMEKPVAVDPVGCRSVIESAAMADQKKLGITCGTQRRHASSYKATMKRIHAGQIGQLVGGQCYWMGRGIWYRKPDPKLTEMEWQCHNWYHWTWLSGDQVCEQQIHNIDIINWCFQGPPVKFLGMGNRQARDYSKQAGGNKKYEGNIFCHIGAELEYANGARVMSMGRHAGGRSAGRVGEKIVGTKGTSNCSNRIQGENPWQFKGRGTGGRTEEHAILIRGMKAGKPVNEGKRIAESTLTAVGCRMSAYTGREFSWDWLLKTSKLDLLPKEIKPGPGHFPPVAVPGVTKLI